jgi:aldehyde:ferredoxin oxidoreductase
MEMRQIMNQLFGYNGKLAYINLSKKSFEIKDLNHAIAEQYIGGVGLSAKLTYDLLSDKDYENLKSDPFIAINPLIFATGPLTGTATPSSSRYSITGISPLTGIWGEATSGGFFPVALKRCGFDALIIIGEADEPNYLFINDGTIEFKDATNIWGKNTIKTTQLIKKELEDDKVRIACIGQAGENLVKYASVMNDEGRAAGRCGLGALMGKKKLKALVVKGKKTIEYFNRNQLIEKGRNALRNIHNAFSTNFFSHYGTLLYTDMGMVLGDVPANYFTNTEFIAENLTGRALKEQFPVLKYACAGCTIGCGRTTIADINGEEVNVHGPEYETMAAFGPMCGIINFKPIIEANHICNLEGIDTISCGVSISFLIYLVENKIALDEIQKYLSDITLEEIKWGNSKTVLTLLNKIIKREGIGNVLADGVRFMAKKMGINSGLAAHVKGLEFPMHEPRAYAGQALTYMTGCIGASHNKGDFYNIDGDAASYPKIRKSDRFNINGREESVITYQDLTNIYDSCVICNFPHINFSTLGTLLNASTGFSSLGKKKTMLLTGERASNLKRLISCKLGTKKEDDYLPEIVTRVLETGGTAGVKLDLSQNLKIYYEKRGWNDSGIPTSEKLDQLGI